MLLIVVMGWSLVGCRERSSIGNEEENAELVEENLLKVMGDSMIYGLACDGSSDSVIVMWPFGGGDPVTYSCIDAKLEGRLIGKPQIGDWVGIMVNPEDTTEATFVIDLDQLKGTWTYPVMPVMKDLQHMSHRMQKRMMENMPDSIKQTYFVPREYGFTLKRNSKSQSVGRIRRSTTLEDDSPVQYPEVKNYMEWHTLNGKLLLVSGERIMPLADGENQQKRKIEVDTLEFVYMDNDSLILMNHGQRMGFHRKENAMKANAAAIKAQQKQDEKK